MLKFTGTFKITTLISTFIFRFQVSRLRSGKLRRGKQVSGRMQRSVIRFAPAQSPEILYSPGRKENLLKVVKKGGFKGINGKIVSTEPVEGFRSKNFILPACRNLF